MPTQDGISPHEIPLLFNRYAVIQELGRGGMGVVLLAHDISLGIPVAVKVVSDQVAKNTEALADLRKEVLRGMALNHDGVVRTHQLEKDASGAGIVMEYVEGDDLANLKAAEPGQCFDPEQILPWIEQLCAVLDYAHGEKRIIHRDLKPRNIMLTKAGRIKVADFGISAVVNDSMSRHSMDGHVSGTLSYMSPQQAEGKRPNQLDDIHALGATIFELLTGKPPFFRGNQATIYQQIIHLAPPTIGERREELEVEGKGAVPPQWEETVAACLSKDPAKRPQSAGEVLARLRTPARSASKPAAKSRQEASQPGGRMSLLAGVAALALAVCGAIYFATDRGEPDALPEPTPSSSVPPPSSIDPLAAATKEKPFVNSLGMEFVPVPGTDVLFSRWETRVKDYRAFAEETKRAVNAPGFSQTDNDPAVNVSWNDAKAFCAWLSEKDGREYRLPTDHEWSVAVGIGDIEGPSAPPGSKDMNIAGVWPWGTQWPPPQKAGNFAGIEADSSDTKLNFDDGFEDTAPVGSFTGNRQGIHDLAGNVAEWCEDAWDPGHPSRVVRGGSFINGDRNGLMSSSRASLAPDYRGVYYGIRVVIVRSVPTPVRSVSPASLPSASAITPLTAATKDKPFINSLGMEFVPVPGTDVLFSRWETRVKDYRAFAKETKREVEKPSFAQTDDHPAVNVSWNDAKAFCAWLSEKEGRTYRLPGDHEWSVAVGIGDREDPNSTPEDKDMKVANVWPWGNQWPPPNGAGNFADRGTKFTFSVPDYRDGFGATAPVGSFTANPHGICDLGGNVWEWCEDAWRLEGTSRALRGASFTNAVRGDLLSSYRARYDGDYRFDAGGFRVVLVRSAPAR